MTDMLPQAFYDIFRALQAEYVQGCDEEQEDIGWIQLTPTAAFQRAWRLTFDEEATYDNIVRRVREVAYDN